jgi:KR domain
MQADVSDFNSLLNAITSVQALYGPIENIVHTAAVFSDATIQTVTDESFELVLRPKVIGAWNLHAISEELKLPLKSFVLLSSVRLVFIAPFCILLLSPFQNLTHVFSTQCSAREPRSNCLRRWERLHGDSCFISA